MDFYILNVSHSQRTDKYITFWRPECKGYSWPLSWAGRYSETEVRSHLDYYNGGENLAVPCEVVDQMGVAPDLGDIDNNAGPVVRHTTDNWKTLLAAVIATPQYKPKPKYPRKVVAQAA